MKNNTHAKYVRGLYNYMLGTNSQYLRGASVKRINKKKIRDIAKVIYYFDKYAKFKHELNNDYDSPWEVVVIFMNNRSNMPRCVKWASQYLVKRIEVK